MKIAWGSIAPTSKFERILGYSKLIEGISERRGCLAKFIPERINADFGNAPEISGIMGHIRGKLDRYGRRAPSHRRSGLVGYNLYSSGCPGKHEGVCRSDGLHAGIDDKEMAALVIGRVAGFSAPPPQFCPYAWATSMRFDGSPKGSLSSNFRGNF